MEPIKFGTDGWRAKIADTYTHANVRRAAFALSVVLKEMKPSCRVLVGYDPRYGSEHFAATAARVLSSQGHEAILSDRMLPTPALSLALGKWKADAGVMITASHNSGEYNGFKIKIPPGVSAPNEYTRKVESSLPAETDETAGTPAPTQADFLSYYLSVLKKRVDVKAIRKAGFRLVADPMHGAASNLLEKMLVGGRTKVTTIAANRDAFFGGRHPEPIDRYLGPLKEAVRKSRAMAGLATDGDADRIGLVDEKGVYVDVHKIHALLLDHLVRFRGMKGSVVRTVSGTLIVDRMAKAFNLPVKVTPIGFKYIGAVMLKENALLGVEESGGMAVKGHLAERDGLFLGLLILEALAARGLSVTKAVARLQREFGPYYSDRVDLENVPAELQSRVLGGWKNDPPERAAGMKVTGVETLDGVKLLLDNGWLLVRASGTEPLLRLYAEADSPQRVKALLKFAADYVQSKRVAGFSQKRC
jgi:phosphomannomutase